MKIGLLGPLCVEQDGIRLAVPAAKQRIVLAALAALAGRVVTVTELAELVWDGAFPDRPPATVRNYVKRLRQVLGAEAGRRIVSCYPGYLLEASADEVDVLAVAGLCRAGGAAVRAGDWAGAFDVLSRALGLWRDQPLCDVPSEILAQRLLPRLERLRLQAAEWRAEAGLSLGLHQELAGDLADLAEAHPLRERFHAQLMLALYRCGRQGEALAAYQDARRALVAELGVEPGPDLAQLHQRILAADPRLMMIGRVPGWPLPTHHSVFSEPPMVLVDQPFPDAQ